MMCNTPASDGGLVLRFWGVRGSVPVSGPDTVEFGGATPCLEVSCGGRLFLIDAGTGLFNCGQHHRDAMPKQVDLLFSHLHLDHVGGLPFFKPAIFDAERRITTYCGNLGGDSAASTIDRLFSPPIFPVTLDVLPCALEHRGFKAGDTLTFEDGLRVETIPLNHPQGSVGYKFRHAGKTLCVISDLEHSDPWPDPALRDFVAGCDLMVYDGMFTDCEYPRCKGWGHSTWQKGVELARAADVKALAIIHLHPAHSDAVLRAMEADMQAEMPASFVARERQVVEVGEPLFAARRGRRAEARKPVRLARIA